VFLLGFYTLSAKLTRRARLPLNARSSLWQDVGSGCAMGASNDSRHFTFCPNGSKRHPIKVPDTFAMTFGANILA
jgi:hypothetical protein